MIPVKLTLQNFMSYGDEPTMLDFTGMHVVSLSGDNGNGKSALLDAITYALWGETRASGSQASSEDDLVRLGAEEMEVTLDFRLGDELYRVLRKRNRRTRSGEWQLQLCDATGAWRPAGGTSMRETQRQIENLLRMGYETFLNSAYIQQGRADEFTRQKPNDRKRILADILDLRRYDRLEQMAKERRNECQLLLSDLEGEIRHLGTRAEEEAGHQSKLSEQEAELARWAAARAECEGRLSNLRAQLAVLDEKAHRLREREERLREVEAEVREAQGRITALRAKMAQDAALIAEKPAILAGIARLGELRELHEKLEPEVTTLHEAERSKTQAEGRIEAARQKLLGEIAHAEANWQRSEERARQILEVEARLADIGPKLEHFNLALPELEQVRSHLANEQQAFADLSARNKQLNAEIVEIDEVLELLDGQRPACPVCESDLSGGKQARVVHNQRLKREEKQCALQALKHEGLERKKVLKELQDRANSLEEQVRGAAALKAQYLELGRRHEELMEQNRGSAALLERLAELRQVLTSEGYAPEDRQMLVDLSRRLDHLKASADRQAAVAEEIRALTAAQVERRHAQLEEAERSQAEESAEVERLEGHCAKRLGQIATERARQEAMGAELGEHDAMKVSALATERELAEAGAACDRARSQVERSRQAIEDCARAREQAKAKKAERDRVAHDKQAYTDLVAAFGRKGVQALIIDNALPEIQEEANRLLARMTDNAMQIGLSTLKTARSSSAQIETLDISITDDAGTRPYEMYSGGEAFRVNFAIRIALSRLLARRAGARLQTLILDEGFGTQDAKGRERLVEAIEAIKDEFTLILVISHIEELKDAFSTRIEVIKTPEGSQINYLQ